MNEFIPISKPVIGDLEKKYVLDALESGWISSLGKYIELFEERFAEFCQTKYAISVSNGTTGLHLALHSLGIKKGDEVIIPNLTFVATANAVKYTGAKPIYVDVDRSTLCISPKAIETAITSKTKAIIPVHLYGHPANMGEILQISKRYNLRIIEDAAEAHGARYQNKRVGGLGDAGVFSFYGNKIITTGEGGMITTNNYDLYERMKFYRDHAMSKSKRYWHPEVGFNYRLTNLQAALGLAQLQRIDSIIRERKDIFRLYDQRLSGLPNVKLNSKQNWAESVYWLICLEIDGYSETLRDAFMNKLKSKNIDCRPYFYPLSEMMNEDNDVNTPITKDIHSRGICLPTFSGLKEKQINYICDEIIELL